MQPCGCLVGSEDEVVTGGSTQVAQVWCSWELMKVGVLTSALAEAGFLWLMVLGHHGGWLGCFGRHVVIIYRATGQVCVRPQPRLPTRYYLLEMLYIDNTAGPGVRHSCACEGRPAAQAVLPRPSQAVAVLKCPNQQPAKEYTWSSDPQGLPVHRQYDACAVWAPNDKKTMQRGVGSGVHVSGNNTG
jgi:hypothetical protein